MPDRLAVWLYGTRVALVERVGGRLRLTYTDEALARFPLGAPLLSLSMPLTDQRYTHGLVRPFLDGLLPEGDARLAAAAEADVPASDTYGLLRAIGRDCAGAIVVQPEEDSAPPAPTTATAAPLTDEELADRVARLPSAPLGIDRQVRLSLAGAQAKLLLTRMPDGSWGRPINGTPSTHILKPEIPAYPGTVENEAFCMRMAKHLGLPVAEVEVTAVAGQRLIVVERFDREVHSDGSVERIHDEDFCQALGIPPEQKYQDQGGPSLRSMARLLESVAEPNALDALLRATTFNVVVGNGDAHGKNFSLIHAAAGAVRLAPLYDLVSTLIYGLDRLAMYIDAVQRIDAVTVERLVNEATGWGMTAGRARTIIQDVLAAVPDAAAQALAEIPGTPEALPSLIDGQLAVLQGRRPPSRRGRSRARRLTPGDLAAIRS
jgi:serine/threonine-protein kinase HipA